MSFVTRHLACSAQSATSLPSNFRVGPLANHWISARNIGLILETLCRALPYLRAHVSCHCCCCYVIDVIVFVVETGSPELPQCGHCPHAGRGPRSRACLWKNNFEESYANEAWHSFFDSERLLLHR